MSNIATGLRAFRKTTGLNQKMFAASVGLKYTTYNGYETGGHIPSTEVLQMIAEKYMISVDQLIGGAPIEEGEVSVVPAAPAASPAPVSKPAPVPAPSQPQTPSQAASPAPATPAVKPVTTSSPAPTRMPEQAAPVSVSPAYPGSLVLSPSELDLIERFRGLDRHGKEVIAMLMAAEAARINAHVEFKDPEPPVKPSAETRTIRLYRNINSIGKGNPVFGVDYEEIFITNDKPGDFAIRVNEDSLEPYVRSGDVAFVESDGEISYGDVGVFYAMGVMHIKQYYKDEDGNIRLLTLNRNRSADDVFVEHGQGVRIECFGKLVLPYRPPLPNI